MLDGRATFDWVDSERKVSVNEVALKVQKSALRSEPTSKGEAMRCKAGEGVRGSQSVFEAET